MPGRGVVGLPLYFRELPAGARQHTEIRTRLGAFKVKESSFEREIPLQIQ